MDDVLEILRLFLLYTLAFRGAIAVIGLRPFWWPKEPEKFSLEDLTWRANCGTCGNVINEVVPKDWPWGLCEDCIQKGEVSQ